MKTQIPKTKYKAGLKIFNHHKKQIYLPIPNINAKLRSLEYSDKEIETFWNSNAELKTAKDCWERDQKWINDSDNCEVCLMSLKD
jgi:hypothetical protein